MRYREEPTAPLEPDRIGLLLANLGTPEAPTAAALRPYLREFLWDPRVIEKPRWLWWLILNFLVLPRRPARSAALYAKIWTAEGSPLLVISRRLAAAMRAALGTEVEPALGMRYGEPSIAGALRELRAAGCGRVLVLPLYPQYFAGTTASTFDAVFAELETWRRVPEVRTIASYHDDPAYIAALAASVRELWDRDGRPAKLVVSFHGVPKRYVDSGDPYRAECEETARLLAAALGLGADGWTVVFQSQFGREEWLQPYAEQAIPQLARDGVASIDVIAPGFSADCLETLEEIDGEYHESFLAAGGERFRYVPALNDRDEHVRLLADLVRRNVRNW